MFEHLRREAIREYEEAAGHAWEGFPRDDVKPTTRRAPVAKKKAKKVPADDDALIPSAAH